MIEATMVLGKVGQIFVVIISVIAMWAMLIKNKRVQERIIKKREEVN